MGIYRPLLSSIVVKTLWCFLEFDCWFMVLCFDLGDLFEFGELFALVRILRKKDLPTLSPYFDLFAFMVAAKRIYPDMLLTDREDTLARTLGYKSLTSCMLGMTADHGDLVRLIPSSNGLVLWAAYKARKCT